MNSTFVADWIGSTMSYYNMCVIKFGHEAPRTQRAYDRLRIALRAVALVQGA